MSYTLGKLKLEDFDKWKADWDASIELRRAAGQKSYQILRNIDDAKEIVLVIEWDDLDAARMFAQSLDLQETLRRSGVVEMDLSYVEEIEKGTL